MNKLQIALIFVLFASAQAGWYTHMDILNTNPITEQDAALFDSNPDLGDIKSVCGSWAMLGGYNLLGLNNEISTFVKNLPAHNEIRVSFTLYLIDSWDANDQVNFYGDQLLLGSQSQSSNQAANICGGMWADRALDQTFIINHKDCDFHFNIEGQFNSPPNDESFGISHFKVEFYQDQGWDFDEKLFMRADNSAQWETPDASPGIGAFQAAGGDCKDADGVLKDFYTVITGDSKGVSTDYCWEILAAQDCFDALGLLSNEGYSINEQDGSRTYGDVVSTCRSVEDNGQWSYDFLIAYVDDYVHIDDCVEQEVNFVQTGTSYDPNVEDAVDDRSRAVVPPSVVSKADGVHDQWWWNPCTEQITFTVDLDDLVDEWLCTYTENDEYYEWLCTIELNIYFSGEIQFTYEFQMCSTLDRTTSATLDVTVNRNVVYGDCCVNELQVQSSLHFCSNLDCLIEGVQRLENPADWDNDYKEVERKQVFWVAHRIDTSEFQTYFLQPMSLMIGPFVPEIHNWVQLQHSDTFSTQGYTNLLVYELESYVALDNLEIVSVAKLDDRDWQDVNAAFDQDGAFDQPDGYDGLDFNGRMLEEDSEQISVDYKIKSFSQLSVIEKSDEQKQIKSSVNASYLLQLSSLVLLAVLLI